jgi:hypothetical protein
MTATMDFLANFWKALVTSAITKRIIFTYIRCNHTHLLQKTWHPLSCIPQWSPSSANKNFSQDVQLQLPASGQLSCALFISHSLNDNLSSENNSARHRNQLYKNYKSTRQHQDTRSSSLSPSFGSSPNSSG